MSWHLPSVTARGYECSCGHVISGVAWTAAREQMWQHITSEVRRLDGGDA